MHTSFQAYASAIRAAKPNEEATPEGHSGMIVDEHDAISGLARAKMFECVVNLRHRECFRHGSDGMPRAEGQHPVNRRRPPVGEPETDFWPKMRPKAGIAIGSSTLPTT